MSTKAIVLDANILIRAVLGKRVGELIVGNTVLSSRMPWQQIEASVAHIFSGKVRAGKKLPAIDLFGEQVQMSAVKSNAGRPRVPLRTMIALLYLKHASCLIADI